MSILNKLNHFKPHEFPADVETYCRESVFSNLDAFRRALGSNVYPSPLPDGWYRLDGSETSRHYAVGRQSDACDVFVDCRWFYALITAIQCGYTGIGIYHNKMRNGKKQLMLHLDNREGPLVIWMENKAGDRLTVHPRPHLPVGGF